MPQPSPRPLADVLAPALFFLGLLLLVFGLGMLSAYAKVFPYPYIARAESSARAVWNAYFDDPPFDLKGWDQTPAESGAVVHDRARVAPGLTFLAAYAADGFEGRLVDGEGKTVHRWHARFSEVFKEAPHLRWQARDIVIAWHGVHLFPNGDVVFNFQDASFPYGGGLVRIDRDSKVLWTLPRNTHHDVFVDDQGMIWVPAQRYHDDGVEGFPDLKGGYYEDLVLKVSPKGEVLREISVLNALKDLPGLLNVNYNDRLEVEQEDPTHLNNVEVLQPRMAAAFPWLKPGDLMVSLRNVNALVFIDGATGRAKGTLQSLFVRQHDPDFLPNGHIMVFDNRGGDPTCGGSRVLEIDPASEKTVWSFDGCGGEPFFSETRGEQEVLENGNVLITESKGGRVLEVTHDPKPEVVWEYYNVLGKVDGKPRVGLITHAQRVRPETLAFVDR